MGSRTARWRAEYGLLSGIALAKVGLHLALLGRYGIFRDELYFLACARHLAWGYVDHPPLSIAILAGIVSVLGDSLLAIRLLPVLCGGAVVFLTGVITKELGGERFAQVVAALSVLIAPNVLAMSTYYSMNSIEQVLWPLATWCLIRRINSDEPRWWIAFGAVVGVALLNKLGTGVFALSVGLGVLATRWRRDLLSPWLHLGWLLALAIFLPHLLWQIHHDWPFFAFVRGTREWMPPIPPLQFLSNQILTHHPITFPLWLAGAVHLLVAPRMRPYRMLGIVFVSVFAVFLLQEGKDYYVTPVYPIALASGAVALERTLAVRRWRPWAKPALLGTLVLAGAALAPGGMPILSPKAFERYAAALGIAPPAYIDQGSTPLPQHLADRFGWPELVGTIAAAYESLPLEERPHARILCGNWGQAGAVDYFGRRHGLPHAISPLHSYWDWGPGDAPAGSFVVIGVGGRDVLLDYFDRVEEHGRVVAPYAIEDGQPVFVARGLKRDLADLWQELRRF